MKKFFLKHFVEPNKNLLCPKISVSKKMPVHKNFGPQKKAPNNMGPKSLVKIWSVKAEIFLIWTSVSRTDVDCTNVTLTGDIC